MPKTSIARERYPIRKSRLQPPLHAHECITKTCKYRHPVFLNSINNNSDILRNIIDEINNITLVKFKSRVGKMPAFMSKVHAGGIYRRLLVFTGVYWNLPAFTDIAGFLLLFLVLAQN